MYKYSDSDNSTKYIIYLYMYFYIVHKIPLKPIQIKTKFGKVAGYEISIKTQFYFCI